MRVRETAIRFVHRVVPEKKPDPVAAYDDHILAAAGLEIRRKESQAETIRRMEEAEDRLDTYLQHDAWYGGDR